MIRVKNMTKKSPKQSEDKRQKGSVYMIDVDQLTFDKNQPRKYFDKKALEELKKSIIQYGLVQPIVFRETGSKLIVVAGERRLRAFKGILKDARKTPENEKSKKLIDTFSQISALCIEGDHQEIALIENTQRENLNPVELAQALQSLKDQKSYTQETIGELIGLAKSTVSGILSINTLPDEVLDEAKAIREVPQWVLIECAKPKGKKAKVNKWKKLKESGLTQGAYRKEKTKKKSSDAKPEFNLNNNLRFIKTASTQMKKLITVPVNEIQDEDKTKLKTELEQLQEKLSQMLASLSNG
jgi:ParB family chromosome partitioning protein